MAKLSEEEAAQLKALQDKAEAPDEPAGGGTSRQEIVNITIDLDNDVQVKRAVKSGLLPKSYLDDDEDDGDGDGDGDDDEKDDRPRRRLDGRYS